MDHPLRRQLTRVELVQVIRTRLSSLAAYRNEARPVPTPVIEELAGGLRPNWRVARWLEPPDEDPSARIARAVIVRTVQAEYDLQPEMPA